MGKRAPILVASWDPCAAGGCLLPAAHPVCKSPTKPTRFFFFYHVCKTPMLESEILKGPCSVSKKCFSISDYPNSWEHPAGCAILLLPGGWDGEVTPHLPSAPRSPCSFAVPQPCWPCRPLSFEIRTQPLRAVPWM